MNLVEFIDAIVEISRASAAAGWVAGVIGVHPWQLALFDDAAQRSVCATSAARRRPTSVRSC